MRWVLRAYESLESVDMKSSLRREGYDKCWDCADFRAKSFARFGTGQQVAVPDTDSVDVKERGRVGSRGRDPPGAAAPT